jgi:hypothetical protein
VFIRLSSYIDHSLGAINPMWRSGFGSKGPNPRS